MNSLTKTDLHFLVSRLPKDVVAMVKREQLFIAGGFIRSNIAGERATDIDIFGSSIDQLKIAALDLTNSRGLGTRFHQTANAFTVLSSGRIPVQFIHRWTYASNESERLMDEFDFTIAKAVIWCPVLPPDNSLEWQSICHDDFYSDLAAKRLVYTSPQRAEDAGGSMMRVRKFLQRGYNIQPHSLGAVIARLLSGVRNIDDDSGRQGMTTEQWNAKVIASLLREVDPLRIVDGIDIIEEEET